MFFHSIDYASPEKQQQLTSTRPKSEFCLFFPFIFLSFFLSLAFFSFQSSQSTPRCHQRNMSKLGIKGTCVSLGENRIYTTMYYRIYINIHISLYKHNILWNFLAQYGGIRKQQGPGYFPISPHHCPHLKTLIPAAIRYKNNDQE